MEKSHKPAQIQVSSTYPEVSLHPSVVPLHVGRGVQHHLHPLHPEQLLAESLPPLPRQSCARTDTAGGGGLGTGCKEDIASPSSVMVEETPGGGWDRGVGGHGGGLLC